MTLAEATFSTPFRIRDLQGDSVVLTRLRELGFVKGASVQIVGCAPFGEPILVEIRNAVVALRKDEAKCVFV